MYYQGSSEIQADGLQTLYLMNPNYTAGGYSDEQPQPAAAAANMLILNYASSAAANTLNFASLSSGQQPQPQPQPQHHLLGIPLQGSMANTALGSGNNNSHELRLNQQLEVIPSPPRTGIIPHFHHSLWGSLDQNGAGNSGGFPRAVVTPTQQGLSLSLSPQQPGYNRSLPVDHSNISSLQAPFGGGGSSSSVSAVSNNGFNISGVQSAVSGSKYLKAAQELLDELVKVGKGIKNESIEKGKEKAKMYEELTNGGPSSTIGNNQSDPKGGGLGAELTTAQKQEIQIKKAKLINMLDEVEQRCRQYHHQMQIVVATFEQATGIGSARSYTQLALQTITKQFRCLKNAISEQIKAASKSLGEDEKIHEGSSRLKFVEQQLKQQRALQHLGMVQNNNNNAWRPQRGLPERAVSVLRGWLFEHFLHPYVEFLTEILARTSYPKDSDKQMLAKQTGLTRSQVSNWFINARVRLWKPMVEEMYTEEMKNQEDQDHGSESNKESGSKSTPPKDINNASRRDQGNNIQLHSKKEKIIISQLQADASPADHQISTSTASISPPGNSPQAAPAGRFGLVCALNMKGNIAEKNPKKLRSITDHHMQNSPSSILSVDHMDMKFGDHARKGFNKFSSTNDQFGAFSIGELGQFNPEQLGFHGNGVSLTLGLPPSDHQNFLSDHQNMDQLGSNRLDQMGTIEQHFDQRVNNKPQTSHSSIGGYETIDFQNRKRFAAQLLPDFVA